VPGASFFASADALWKMQQGYMIEMQAKDTGHKKEVGIEKNHIHLYRQSPIKRRDIPFIGIMYQSK
jgi:hypothetical protein